MLKEAEESQWVQCLPGMQDALGLNLSTARQSRLVHIYNPSTWVVELQALQVQGRLWLHTYNPSFWEAEGSGWVLGPAGTTKKNY